MADHAATSKLLQKILADALTPDEERVALETLATSEPQTALSLLPVYAQQKARCRGELEVCRKEVQQLGAMLKEPPWLPATVIQVLADDLFPGESSRVLVAVEGRWLVVAVGPGIEASRLRSGVSVLLNNRSSLLVAMGAPLPRPGNVATFSRYHDGLAVIRGPGDEEIAVALADEVRSAGFRDGDLVLYDRSNHLAYGRVDKGPQAAVLEGVPDVRFEDIGGLDGLVEAIRDEVALHILHPDLVASHRLKPSKGLVLCGSPGCGKTMIANALANHLARLKGIAAMILNVRPGMHRSMWYGGTEERIRSLFATARRAATGEGRFVVMLFDDVDHLGSRGDNGSTAIDTRVLPAFLGEIDALADCPNIWIVATTNRPDLLDEALMRPGRFGDRVFRVPRPGREAARQIFARHFTANIPYAEVNGHGPEHTAAAIVDEALAWLYAPNGEGAVLATLVLRDGSRRPVAASDVISGALIAETAAQAKRRSCLRAARGLAAGITSSDLLIAIDRQLTGVIERLKPGPALRQMLDLPSDLDVVAVEVDPRRRTPASHEYLSTQRERAMS